MNLFQPTGFPLNMVNARRGQSWKVVDQPNANDANNGTYNYVWAAPLPRPRTALRLWIRR